LKSARGAADDGGVMFNDIDSLIKLADERSIELIEELAKYTKEVIREDPANVDAQKAFECWVIQKIAGVQILIETVNEELQSLGGCGRVRGERRGGASELYEYAASYYASHRAPRRCFRSVGRGLLNMRQSLNAPTAISTKLRRYVLNKNSFEFKSAQIKSWYARRLSV
jgi:hypothetical protein